MSGDLRYKAASYIKFGEKKILVRKKIEKKTLSTRELSQNFRSLNYACQNITRKNKLRNV